MRWLFLCINELQNIQIKHSFFNEPIHLLDKRMLSNEKGRLGKPNILIGQIVLCTNYIVT